MYVLNHNISILYEQASISSRQESSLPSVPSILQQQYVSFVVPMLSVRIAYTQLVPHSKLCVYYMYHLPITYRHDIHAHNRAQQ